MGKLSSLEIIVNQPKSFYSPGETISGRVIVTANKDLTTKGVIIKLHGHAFVHWSEQRSTGRSSHTVVYQNRRQFYLIEQSLAEPPDKELTLRRGTTEYPFSLTLPNGDQPASFDGKYGYVRHELEASIKAGVFNFDKHQFWPFTMVHPVVLSRTASLRQGSTVTNTKRLCCLCCTSGPITASLRLLKLGFVAGEIVEFDLDVDNKSRRQITNVHVQLRQTATFRTTSKSRNHSEHIVEAVNHLGVGRGQQDHFTSFQLVVPPVCPTVRGDDSIIDVRYYVEAVVKFAGPALSLVVSVPVTIGTEPFYDIVTPFQGRPDDAWRAPLEADLVQGRARYSARSLTQAVSPVYVASVAGEFEPDSANLAGEITFKGYVPVYPYYYFPSI